MAQRTAPTAPAKPVASRERGYALATSAQNYWSQLLDPNEQTPELQWPRSVEVYDRMRRTDAQVRSTLQAIMLPVRKTRWFIDPNGASADVVALVAGDLGLPIRGQDQVLRRRSKGRFSWPEHLRHALLMLPFGHMFFEQLYALDDAGFAHLRKLGPRMPTTIAKFNVATDGGLVSIEQRSSAGAANVVLSVDRLVGYVHEREGGNWQGMSILRGAYKNWLIKDRLLRVDAQSVERNGMGIPVYTAPDGEQDLSKGQEIASSIRAGETAGAAIPYGAKLELLGITGNVPKALDSVKYHDEQIARQVLAHFLNLGSQTGSWALGTTFAEFFTQALQATAQQVADVTTAHVIEDLVDVNFGSDEPAPTLGFVEIGSKSDEILKALQVLVATGAIKVDQSIEEFARQTFGLPAGGQEVPANG